jgi:hypothetical protein
VFFVLFWVLVLRVRWEAEISGDVLRLVGGGGDDFRLTGGDIAAWQIEACGSVAYDRGLVTEMQRHILAQAKRIEMLKAQLMVSASEEPASAEEPGHSWD